MANVETDGLGDNRLGNAVALDHTVEEGLLVWSCTFAAYSDYLAALLQARSVEGLFKANAKLMSDSVDLFGRAAGCMQQYHGAITPTLNDA